MEANKTAHTATQRNVAHAAALDKFLDDPANANMYATSAIPAFDAGWGAACNAHDDLVKALQEAQAVIRDRASHHPVLIEIADALAAAEAA